MKAIMVMFDSLNRRFLPPYGCDWIKAPNFERLAQRTVTFENSFVGSMPCMPARREIHTGRYNFLHRSWGPIEPFDDSMPEILQRNGIYTHLVTDHYHYWEDGGATYHNRYSSCEFSRGQEGDLWKAEVRDPEIPPCVAPRGGQGWRQDWINRKYIRETMEFPQAVTFSGGVEFLRTNHDEDNWFLHIETFDPHEPFFASEEFRKMYPDSYKGSHFDWPLYRKVEETPEQVEHVRNHYKALVSMCDFHLGRILDLMDELDLWKDTMLIVNTDHGFLLGEHDWWAKCVQPFFNEVAHTPLFVWDPRCGVRGERRKSLVQTIDLAPTLLEYFGVDHPKDMQGVPLKDTVARDIPVREAGLFGIHGGHVNVTDGRYVYMRAPVGPDNQPLFNYTTMTTHMKGFFRLDELGRAEISEPFSFMKGCRVMKTPSAGPFIKALEYGNLLFDLEKDPEQQHPIENPEVERRMIEHLVSLMRANDAPKEQFERLGV